MNERRNRCRAFHRIGKPNEQRDLRALSKRAEHEAVGDRRRGPRCALRRGSAARRNRLEQRVVLDGAVILPNQKHTERETEVADAVHDERFFGGGDRTRPGVEVANEQVTREAHAFPAEVEHDQVAAHHERAHGKEEEAHRRKESGVALADIGFHVLGRVNGDQRSQAGHEEHPQQCQRVDIQRERREEPRPHHRARCARSRPRERHPVKHVDGARRVSRQLEEERQRGRERSDQCDRSDRARQLALDADGAAKQAEDRRKHRQEKDQPGPREFRRGDRGGNLKGCGRKAGEFKHVEDSVVANSSPEGSCEEKFREQSEDFRPTRAVRSTLRNQAFRGGDRAGRRDRARARLRRRQR